ncbi:MAG: hypothetical protein CVV44_17715 [Spirochaetae bacterium HGW-Spirochaetae-1]|jgi:adenylate cyclase class 1|nr:MAG: hypothetical protein CVV44_17715 [Spirochaetae bacterium HGW-Spirochaetae-1]
MSFIETIEKNRENFLTFNRAKFDRFQQLITNTAIKKVVNAIPLLLCVNDRKIPGFVEGKVPLGIAGYEPDRETIKYLENRFHKTGLSIHNQHPFVEMLAVMGSVGTIAYTKQSDFDYWVCIDRKGVPADVMSNFQRKIDEIQKWTKDEAGIDVHLFPNDISNLRNNIYAEDEDEAFGSTIGATLKDEFYRSSIIIAGKIPFWWVVPRIGDREYDMLYQQVPAELREEYYIDLGNLYNISKEDFLGSALFQLIKALGNPFKSILKIGILEKYLFGSDQAYLISQKIKSAIHKGDFDNKILDSYVLLFEEVYDYYNATLEDRNLLTILRQNLYLKINPQLSKYAAMQKSKNLPYKVIVMFSYVKEWNWTAADIKENDNFDNWDYKKIMFFWNMVKKFMLLSYQKIARELPAMNLAQSISESDFMLLSRKIKANFTPNEDEIDNYVTFKDTPHESILYVEPLNAGITDIEWRLYKRDTSSTDKFISTTLKTERDLVKLMTWTAINQIFNPTFTRLQIQSGYSRINQNLILELLTEISNLFVGGDIYLKNEFYLNRTFNTINMIIINFNRENADALESIYHVFKTSWGQSYIHHYTSEDALIGILETILCDGILLKRPYEKYCAVNTPEPFKKMYKDIDRLFRETYDFIVQSNPPSSLRLVTRIGSHFVVINRDGAVITVTRQPHLIKMLASLTVSPKKAMTLHFQGGDPRIMMMEAIYNKRKKNSISIIYEDKKEHVLMYILDERGNIFSFVKPQADKEQALLHLYEFSKNVIESINNEKVISRINVKIEVLKLARSKQGEVSFSNESSFLADLHLMKFRTVKPTVAIIARYNDNQYYYCIKTPGASTDFTPLKNLSQKLSGIKTQIGGNGLISAIEFNGIRDEDMEMGSAVYFLEKYRLEFVLAKLLSK